MKRLHHFLLAALVVMPAVGSSAPEAWAETPAEVPDTAASPANTQDPIPPPAPLAPEVKGNRPKSDPSVLPPAATTLPPELKDLAAPESLALPVKPSQVRIRQLRPLGLADVETLIEVNNPALKALASQVEQAQSALRAQIALWYPTIALGANSLPAYTAGGQFSSGLSGTGQATGNTSTKIWQMQAALQASWALINPSRTPSIAAARDEFEKAKDEYLIGLREQRLAASEAFFTLQVSDETVRIGQESVRSSLVSLRDAKARFQAGVATKLEVLEAETQLARDQQVLTEGLADQATARRTLAALLDLPQHVTPTSKEPSRVVGTWLPSLQESIVAAYAFREELDQILLDISIANSQANAALGEVQPFLSIFNQVNVGRTDGYQFAPNPIPGNYGWSATNTVGLNLQWTIFDGGAARANYRQGKQRAQQNRFLFAQQRDAIRQQVEDNFFQLEKNNRNITTTSREVISTRESLRLARLRFQAGVTTQREVVDTQRDLTTAQVRWSQAISDYNIALARLRRFTGLDQIGLCQAPSLPATSPGATGDPEIPVEPQPLLPACQASDPTGGVQSLPGQ